MSGSEKSWRLSFRRVVGKPGNRSNSFVGVPITGGVHDNHFCSANPRFIAVVTESVGGGSFLVLPIHQTGRVDPQHPRVRGHRGPVLDVKWNPFDDLCVASCSEDCTVKVWNIPEGGVQQELLGARTTLIGHRRRVGLIQWHPTAENLLLSSAYDYSVLLWDVSQPGRVLRRPLRVVVMPVQRRHPPEALLLSVSFSEDGGRLASASGDRRVRVLDPRTGRVLQVSAPQSHRALRVLWVGGLRMLLSTGRSPWNHRQAVLWDPEDLSKPLHEEDLDEAAGVVFPFYDADTRLLYLAGKVGNRYGHRANGDASIRCYELSNQKPHLHFLTEFRTALPQKGLAAMPKRGLDVNTCEIFRFYRLIAVVDVVEPLSVVAARPEKDPYPSTAGRRAVVTAREWLRGVDEETPMMSLNAGVPVPNPYPESPARPLSALRFPPRFRFSAGMDASFDIKDFLEEELAYQGAKYPKDAQQLAGWQPDETAHRPLPSERTLPTPTGDELLRELNRQQEEIRELWAELGHRDVRMAELELKIGSV